MSPENFVYWLKGWIELNKTIDHRGGATEETILCIEDHLNLVLKKETPVRQKLVGLPPVPDNAPTIVETPYQMPRLGVAPVPPMFGPNEALMLTC